MIGSLLYLTATRPDIQFSVCLCARFQASPRTSHRQAVKLIFTYLHHTPTSAFGTPRLLLWRFMVFQMRILPGVSWIGSPLLGLACFLGSSLVSWSSRKQSSVAQSTIEAEYIAATSCCSQILWITYTMSDFGDEYTHVPLQCDSTC
jgi:hypothetical protein